jgi:hypothetical protein
VQNCTKVLKPIPQYRSNVAVVEILLAATTL